MRAVPDIPPPGQWIDAPDLEPGDTILAQSVLNGALPGTTLTVLTVTHRPPVAVIAWQETPIHTITQHTRPLLRTDHG